MEEKKLNYQFYYGGNFDAVDIEPVLNCQLALVKALEEITRHAYPESQLSIKIKGAEKGSLILPNVLEIMTPVGLFIVEHKEMITTVLKTLSQLISLKSVFKGKKPIFEKKDDGTVNVFLNIQDSPNAVVNISDITSNIYQNSKIINGALENIGKNLEMVSDDVESFSVIEEDTEIRLVDIPNTDFTALSEPNTLFDTDIKEDIKPQVRLYVWKPDLMTEEGKKSEWVFNYKGRNIRASVKDKSLIDRVNDGARFGQGDILIADLIVHLKYDKRVDTYVESKKFDVNNVTNIVFKNDLGTQTKID